MRSAFPSLRNLLVTKASCTTLSISYPPALLLAPFVVSSVIMTALRSDPTENLAAAKPGERSPRAHGAGASVSVEPGERTRHPVHGIPDIPSTRSAVSAGITIMQNVTR
ncbi:hypothetical protein ACIQUM_20740 [Amycolatopsis azurea]|uniref:hypothetical protein n=1 Tax=Amycolatopsis azurea TaxID=36819 RepID=UPI0037F36A16